MPFNLVPFVPLYHHPGSIADPQLAVAAAEVAWAYEATGWRPCNKDSRYLPSTVVLRPAHGKTIDNINWQPLYDGFSEYVDAATWQRWAKKTHNALKKMLLQQPVGAPWSRSPSNGTFIATARKGGAAYDVDLLALAVHAGLLQQAGFLAATVDLNHTKSQPYTWGKNTVRILLLTACRWDKHTCPLPMEPLEN